jgi:hypothetical protein
MLNTEDEDCTPVWPSEVFAQAWATGDWSDCEPKAIDLNTWHSRWTQGLEDDDVAIAVFPSENEEGLVISAQEFDFELKTKARKLSISGLILTRYINDYEWYFIELTQCNERSTDDQYFISVSIIGI